MELVTPGLGLIIWMTIAFGIVLYILKKFAWVPIMTAIKQREDMISQSIRDAKHIQNQMLELETKKKDKMEEAKKEYQLMLSHAKAEGEQIIRESRLKANAEARQMLKSARLAIEQQKQTALKEAKSEVADLSISLAQKVLEREFADSSSQSEYINEMLNRLKKD